MLSHLKNIFAQTLLSPCITLHERTQENQWLQVQFPVKKVPIRSFEISHRRSHSFFWKFLSKVPFLPLKLYSGRSFEIFPSKVPFIILKLPSRGPILSFETFHRRSQYFFKLSIEGPIGGNKNPMFLSIVVSSLIYSGAHFHINYFLKLPP